MEILQKTIKLFFSVPLFLENDKLFDFNFCTDAIDFAQDVTWQKKPFYIISPSAKSHFVVLLSIF